MTRTKWARRAVAVAAASVLGLTTMGSIASADDIVSDVAVVGTVKQMALNLGEDGTTVLSLVETRDDGEPGCNIQGKDGGQYVTFSVSSSDAGVATVSPSSVTFGKCSDEHVLTVNAAAAGSTNVTLSQTGVNNSDGGTFNPAPAAFTVVVAGPTNTAPQISISGVADGGSYAKGAVPAAVCEVTDVEDGDSTFPADLSDITGSYAGDGIGEQTATCSYTDEGGLTVTETATYSIVDPSAPVISYQLTPPSADGDNGWYKSSVQLTWTVSEPDSPSSLFTTGCDNVTVDTDQQATDYVCDASSAGGSAERVTVTIKRDATAPEVSLVGGPSGSYYYGDPLPAAPTCEASDATSGLNGECIVSGPTGPTAVGTHSYGAAATDHAGNTTSVQQSYEVLAWTTSGFYKPVNMGDDVWNTVKGGSTVPLKFELFAGDRELTSTSAVASFAAKTVSCETGGAVIEDAVDFTTTGGTTLRYDDKDGQFIQNWQTPKKAGSCYVVTMTAQDGSTISAKFKLK